MLKKLSLTKTNKMYKLVQFFYSNGPYMIKLLSLSSVMKKILC